MARRLLMIDGVKPVAPPPPPAAEAPLNTFPPEAAQAVRDAAAQALIDTAAREVMNISMQQTANARRMIENAPDTEQHRALLGALDQMEQRQQAARRTLVTERPEPRMGVARIDETAQAARAAQERARLQETERAQEARRLRRAGLGDELVQEMMQPAAPKPSVDVRSALGYLASKPANMVELHSVALDMANRGRFTSARQFEYAKAICNRRGNRILLRHEYDLTALDREEWAGSAAVSAPRNHTYAPGVKVGFECVIAGAVPQAVTITFGYLVEGRQSVRTVQVPGNRITIRGGVGERVRCSVDAEWLMTERRINAAQIVGGRLHSGGASAAGPAPVRRRVRH